MAAEKKPTVLIVDYDEDVRGQMKWALLDEYDVVVAGDRQDAVAKVRSKNCGIVCLDLGLPPHPAEVVEGFRALEEIVTVAPLAKVVVITGQGEREYALQAVGKGAYDFFSKPIDRHTAAHWSPGM